MKKKVLATLLSVTMIASVLAGCGGGSSDTLVALGSGASLGGSVGFCSSQGGESPGAGLRNAPLRGFPFLLAINFPPFLHNMSKCVSI